MPAADGPQGSLRVDSVTALDTPNFEALYAEALRTGFGAITRLVDDWRSGANRFAKPGLNIDPYAHRPDIGRIRRLYVIQEARRRRVGSRLVSAIESAAIAGGFSRLYLRTHDPSSARFYETLGYERVPDDPWKTHRRTLL